MSVRHLAMIAILGTLVAWPTVSEAVEFKHDGPAFVPVHQCTCRLDGENIALGEVRCLFTPQGRRTAQCILVQNVTSWNPIEESCPEASLVIPRG